MMGNRVACRAGLWAGLAVLMLGCAAPAAPPAPVAPVVSFDGRWVGTIRVSGSTAGVDASNCAVSPGFTVEVVDNRFQHTMTRAAVIASAPTLRDLADTTYIATIAPDGAVTGMSERTGATLRGRVEGGQMRGEIFGLLCYYAFNARRA